LIKWLIANQGRPIKEEVLDEEGEEGVEVGIEVTVKVVIEEAEVVEEEDPQDPNEEAKKTILVGGSP